MLQALPKLQHGNEGNRACNRMAAEMKSSFLKSKMLILTFLVVVLSSGCSSRLDRLIKDLADDNFTRRYLAVGNLGQISDQRAIAALISALNDEDVRIVGRAIEILGQGADKRAVQALIAKLADTDLFIQYQASRALKKIGSPAVEALIEQLDNKDPQIVKSVVWILGEIRDVRAQDSLIKLVDFPDETVRAAVVSAIAKIDGSKAVAYLIAALNDKDPVVQYEAGLALIQNRRYSLEPLITTLSSANPDLAMQVITVLARIGGPQSIAAIGAALKHPSAGVRFEAVKGLNKIGGPAVTLHLIQALGDTFYRIQDLAAEYLAAKGSDAVEPLLAILARQDRMPVERTVLLLGRIGDRRAVKPLIRVLQRPLLKERQAATQALGILKDPSAIQPLIDVLKQKETELRQPIVDGLVNIGFPAILHLIKMLGDDDQYMRSAATEVLLKMGSQGVAPLLKASLGRNQNLQTPTQQIIIALDSQAAAPLTLLLSDEDERIRLSAAELLTTIGSSAVAALVSTLEGAPEPLKATCVELLGRIGGPDAIKALVSSLSDWNIRTIAADALDGLKWKSTYFWDYMRYLIARGKKDELLRNWDKAYPILWNEIDSGEQKSIEYAASALIDLKQAEAILPIMELVEKRGESKLKEAVVRPLIFTLSSENTQLVQTASEALLQIGVPARHALIDALADPNTRVKTNARQILAQTNASDLGDLENALTHKSAAVRAEVAWLLGRIGRQDTAYVLEKSLQDWEIRRSVADALDALSWKPRLAKQQIYYLIAKGKNLERHWESIWETLSLDLQSDLSADVGYAVKALISFNKQWLITEMINTLERRGTIELAKAYLDSGDHRLEAAAQKWARLKGFTELYEP